LSKGFEKCVLIYDKEDWLTEAKRQIENSADEVKIRDLERYLYTSATETSIDAQGRLVIPQTLKNYAELKRRTAVIGVGDHIEVWDINIWDTHLHEVSVKLTA
jgi:MraZ protein